MLRICAWDVHFRHSLMSIILLCNITYCIHVYVCLYISPYYSTLLQYARHAYLLLWISNQALVESPNCERQLCCPNHAPSICIIMSHILCLGELILFILCYSLLSPAVTHDRLDPHPVPCVTRNVYCVWLVGTRSLSCFYRYVFLYKCRVFQLSLLDSFVTRVWSIVTERSLV